MTRFTLTGGDDVFPGTGQDACGNDSIFGGLGNDSIRARQGRDLIHSGDGDDSAFGGIGNDTITTGFDAGSKHFYGGHGRDNLTASDGDDLLFGGTGNDTIFGLFGSDTIFGGDGNDFVMLNASSHDVVHGGAGFDTVRIETNRLVSDGNPPAVLNVTADFTGELWTMTLNGHAGPILGNFEIAYVLTGSGNDSLLGGTEADFFRSLGGTDYLEGGAGNDTLTADGGMATLLGGDGNDRISVGIASTDTTSAMKMLDGGAGTDVLEVFQPLGDGDGRISILLDQGGHAIRIGGGLVGTAANFESLVYRETPHNFFNSRIRAGSGDDWLNVADGRDTVRAGAGDDLVSKASGHYDLDGGSGIDVLRVGLGQGFRNLANLDFDASQDLGTISLANRGASGTFRNFEAFAVLATTSADTLRGGSGDDTLMGSFGMDRLEGGLGTDRLYGGGGRAGNIFIFGSTDESPAGAADLIVDFEWARDRNRIDLTAIDAAQSTAINDAFSFIGTAAFTAEGQIRVFQDGLHAVVQINTSGSDGAEMAIRLYQVDAATLSEADFLL